MKFKLFFSHINASITLDIMGVIWIFTFFLILASQSSLDFITIFLSAPNLLFVLGVVEIAYGFVILHNKKPLRRIPLFPGIFSLVLAFYYVIFWGWLIGWGLVIVIILIIEGILVLIIKFKE